MGARTPAEVRQLLDAAQLAVAVGAVVSLSLTWWVLYDSDGGADHLTSGWAGLDMKDFGQGWLLLGGVAIALGAVALGSRAARVVAAVAASLAALVMLLGAVTTNGLDGSEAANGVWLGLTLLVATALIQCGVAFGHLGGRDG